MLLRMTYSFDLLFDDLYVEIYCGFILFRIVDVRALMVGTINEKEKNRVPSICIYIFPHCFFGRFATMLPYLIVILFSMIPSV